MLYSATDPIEGDDDGDETATETHTVTRHKASGKFVRSPSQNPMKGKPNAAAMASGAGSGMAQLTSQPKGAGIRPPTRGAPQGGSSTPGHMPPAKDGRSKLARILGRK